MDVKNIRRWYHDIIRDVVQYKSQTKELEYLAYDEVHVIIDWDIKWLHHFLQKKMEHWFTKGSMPCHGVVVFNRLELGEIKKYSFAHTAQESEQIAAQVFFVELDLLRQRKEIFPGVTKATFQSNNAGFYHISMLLCLL